MSKFTAKDVFNFRGAFSLGAATASPWVITDTSSGGAPTYAGANLGGLALTLDHFANEGIDRAARVAARRKGLETASAEVVEERFGQNAAGGIAGAQEKYVVDAVSHDGSLVEEVGERRFSMLSQVAARGRQFSPWQQLWVRKAISPSISGKLAE
jgi:hypothetical protein